MPAKNPFGIGFAFIGIGKCKTLFLVFVYIQTAKMADFAVIN
jgi:hypothetical protein